MKRFLFVAMMCVLLCPVVALDAVAVETPKQYTPSSPADESTGDDDQPGMTVHSSSSISAKAPAGSGPSAINPTDPPVVETQPSMVSRLISATKDLLARHLGWAGLQEMR
jgi:hypothetical protein